MRLTKGDVCEIFMAIAARVCQEFINKRQLGEYSVSCTEDKTGKIILWQPRAALPTWQFVMSLDAVKECLEEYGAIKLKEVIRGKIRDLMDEV